MQLNHAQSMSGRYILSKSDVDNIVTAILKECFP